MKPEISLEDIKAGLQNSLRELRGKDHELLKQGVNERSITHCLAVHLQKEFPDYNVDCEYNRMKENEIKRLLSCRECTNSERTVFPDIIVHRREDGKNNLLVIEAKKTGAPDESCDCHKLNQFMDKKENSGLAYKFSAFIRIGVGEDHSMR